MALRRVGIPLVVVALLVGALVAGRSAVSLPVRDVPPVSCPQDEPRPDSKRATPEYPNATVAGFESTTAQSGGHSFVEVRATNDHPRAVAAWFACRLGTPERTSYAWTWSSRHESDGMQVMVALSVSPHAAGQLPQNVDDVPGATRTLIESRVFVGPTVDERS